MRKKYLAILTFCLLLSSPVQAEQIENNVAVEKQNDAKTTADVINSGQSSNESWGVSLNPQGTLDSYTENSNGFMGVMDDVSKNISTKSNTETVQKAASTSSNISNKIVQFVMAIVPGFMLALSAIEFIILIATPLQGIYEKFFGSGGNNGSLESGGGGKGHISLVSADYRIALQAGGSSGGGSLEGGGSGNSKGGLSAILMTYLKLRMKTIIICVIVMALVLTPVTFNLGVMAAGYVLKGLGALMQWLAGGL